MLTSEKDISLKTIETFYKKDRKASIKSAAESVLLYHQWLIAKKENLKRDIINYNKDDCISTYELREFLIKERPKDMPWFSLSEDVFLHKFFLQMNECWPLPIFFYF